MSFDIKVDHQLLAEVVSDQYQIFIKWIKEQVNKPLSSPCDIVWRLRGTPDPVRIRSNLLTALCVCFHGSHSLRWNWCLADIVSAPDNDELVIEGDDLGMIGAQLLMLGDTFQSSRPDTDDQGVMEIFADFLRYQLASDVWYRYGERLSEQTDCFVMPLFWASEGSHLRRLIDRSTNSKANGLLSSFDK